MTQDSSPIVTKPVSTGLVGGAVKVTVAEPLAVTATAQVDTAAALTHGPPQEPKLSLPVVVALSVTVLPAGKRTEQRDQQTTYDSLEELHLTPRVTREY